MPKFKKQFKKYAKKPAKKYVKRTKPYRKKYVSKSKGGLLKSTALAGAVDKSVYREKHKMTLSKRLLSTLTPVNFYQYNSITRFSAAPGRQTANSINYFLYNDLNPQFASVGGVGANNTKQLFIQSLTANSSIQNAGNFPIQLTMYDVTYKREMDASDAQTFSPELAWNNGEIQQGNALGASMIGSYPTRVDLFTENYKVNKITTKYLAAGAVHQHVLQIEPNKRVSYNRVNTSIRYANLSHATMIVAKGLPCDTSGNTTFIDSSGNPLHEVPPESYYDPSGNPIVPPLSAGQVLTTAPVGINVATTWRYGFRWVADIDSDTIATNNIQTIAAVNGSYNGLLDAIGIAGLAILNTVT